MKKKCPIKIFGSATKMAVAVGVSKSAISQWPQQLTNEMQLKVIGAAVRSGRWSCDQYQQYLEAGLAYAA